MIELKNILQIPSPIQEVSLDILTKKNIKLHVKREDEIHPWISGNKWRKLKYNLSYALDHDVKQIVTFGGAFSNHLYAVAGACALLNIKSVGIIRGEIDVQNPTLKFCIERGMTLVPVSRSAYREKEASLEIEQIISTFSAAMVIPEGGTNDLALLGVQEIWAELEEQLDKMPDYIVLSAGTGGTCAGLLARNEYPTKLVCFSALKSGHLEGEIHQLAQHKNEDKLIFMPHYHFGGYAKWNQNLIDFISDFEQKTEIPLDPVYNGKAMFGLLDMISNDYFPSGSEILYLHTGGLQGKLGVEYRNNK